MARPAEAACAPKSFDGAKFTVCAFDPRRDQIRLFLDGVDGKPYGSLAALATVMKAKGQSLVFAMNAGMFKEDLSPVGLYVENRRKLHEADTRGGATNFHMKPNGVFWVGDGAAGVTETSRYLASPPGARYATQSGPMLVLDGKIHPKIKPSGASEKIRNGVGACDGGAVIFAIAEEPVNFDMFARLFRDGLSCQNAPLSRRLGVVALRARAQSRRRTWTDRADRRGRAAGDQLIPRSIISGATSASASLRLGLRVEHVRRPAFFQSLPHQILLALRRHAAYRRVAVEVGRERIALRAGGDGVVALSRRDRALAQKAFERRIELKAHLEPIDAFHRPAEGRGHLQEVGDPAHVRRAVRPGGMEERGIEEHRVALRERQLDVMLVEIVAKLRMGRRHVAGQIALRERQVEGRPGLERHVAMSHRALEGKHRREAVHVGGKRSIA